MKDKRMVVTGGLGFIGSHLVESLTLDNQVTIIDDHSKGKLENIKDFKLEKLENIDLISGSINEVDLKNIFEDKDYVFHLAARVSVPESVADPLGFNQVNVKGTLKVLIAARDSDVKKVVFASSSAVYGDTTSLPITEDTPLNPLSPYAADKAGGEMYCRVFTEAYGLSTISLRFFNVFGPRQDPNSPYAAAIPNFISAILQGISPVIYGDGEQSRDFVSVREVVNANLLACQSSQTGEYNVGLGKSTTINELMHIIQTAMEEEIEPHYTDPRPGDIRHSFADISRAKSFGYHPSPDFRDDLRDTVQWFAEKGFFE